MIFTGTFSEAVCEKDPGFYQRLNDSRLWEEDKTERQINSLFNDVDFTDKSYHKNFLLFIIYGKS